MEEEGLKEGSGNFLWPGAIGDYSAFLLETDIRLALLLLKAGRCTSSRGGQNEECTFPPATSQRKEDGTGIFL